MPLWGCKRNGAESGRQHGAEARSIPGLLATDPFSGVAGLLNRWAAPVFWEALDEKVTPLLVEDAVENVKLRGAKLELKAAGQVGWLFLSALRMVYRKPILRDEVAALQERQLLIKETIESAVTRGDQMEARCTALAVRIAKQKSRQKPKMPSAVQVRALVCKQKSRQKPKIPSAVQVRALVRKENWDPYTWDGTVSDNDDDWNWEDEVEVHVAELGGVESGEGSVGEVEGGRGSVMEIRPLVQNKSKGVNCGQIQNSRLLRDYTQIFPATRRKRFIQEKAPTAEYMPHAAASSSKTICDSLTLEDHLPPHAIRLMDIPVTNTTESGTESRFYFLDDAPSGRPSNHDAASLKGNPDIRVPKGIEKKNGLHKEEGEKNENADEDAGPERRRPGDTEKRPDAGKTLKMTTQCQITTKREPEGRRFHHVPGGTWLNQISTTICHTNCSRLTDIPATNTTESGTESRFYFLDDTPSGRPSNHGAASLKGNPDIRVPEGIEKKNGLHKEEGEKNENADEDAGPERRRPGDTEKRPDAGKTLKMTTQCQITTKREPEGRRFHHVPGGTWLNQVRSYIKDNLWLKGRETPEEGGEGIRQGEGGGSLEGVEEEEKGG
ncbi:hypothetical protein NDU88_005951 [Pleurodeles waltl]|uniref:Uncharacterized protein n=1 Tax=Pleurodeles waltl TaxID=8319 RepID=A0AAV7NSZ9_PLEWA|nr:hypothetical protein NDU88_005951 [Pleurodeles waltl]